MVIEEIILELDKFITKYKERKDGEEKGASLRNNIKQALTEKGVQGVDTLDDSAIVERIKTLSSSGNTTVEGTQGNNSTNETFAQQVIQILKENHYPFLNSTEDNLQKFIAFMRKKEIAINDLTKKPQVLFNDNGLSVLVTPNDGLAVKVRYTSNDAEHEEVIRESKKINNVTKFSYRECDYYGNFGKKEEKRVFLDPYKQQLEHPENYIFSGDNNGGHSSEVAFTELVDNSDYDIIDLSDVNFYVGIAKKKVKEMNKNKELTRDLPYSLRNVKLNGDVKIAIANSDDNYLGLSLISSPALTKKPKFIVYTGAFFIERGTIKLMRDEVPIEGKYNWESSDSPWYKQDEKYRTVRSAIYRWDSTKNKYMFESIATLEDWLKTHPIETL